MKIVTSAAFVLLLAAGTPALADQDTAPVLADMLLGMQHFPSAEQKSTLAEIAGDEQVDEDLRTIAEAIGAIEHQLPEAEQADVQAIVADPDATGAEKTLAEAVLGFKHQLASQDAEALRALTD